MIKYKHSIKLHNSDSACEIVPHILKIIHPNSVIDVGCGLGDFLRVFKDAGVKKVLGLDGKWCNKELLFKNISPEEFQEIDLEKPFSINYKFDLAVCLEVAEHLSPARAKSFVRNLTELSDRILFSAAIPMQGGRNHYNEQWLKYWSDLFSEFDYELHDVFKNMFWHNRNIFWWYKQNMVLLVNKKNNNIQQFPNQNLINPVVHPDLFLNYADYKAQYAIKRHIKILFKAIFFKMGIIR